MEKLFIQGTQETPEVKFDPATGKLSITGRSYGSDMPDFYKELSKWVDKYVLNAETDTVLEINIDYLHSVSVKFLTKMIRELNRITKFKKKFKVIWHYEEDDDENLDLGKSIQAETGVDFEFVIIVP